MEQLLLHLVGDYLTQTHWMASRKRHFIGAAWIHAVVYSLPFLLLTASWSAIAVILFSHFLIDWLGLARYVVFAKNWLTSPHLTWINCEDTGYPYETPVWLSFWLLIIADNTLHLLCNYAALRWL